MLIGCLVREKKNGWLGRYIYISSTSSGADAAELKCAERVNCGDEFSEWLSLLFVAVPNKKGN